MCYAYNVVSKGKFKGGLKSFVAKYNLTEEQQRKLMQSQEITLVPCGQCLECKINYAKNWAARCEVESYYHENNYFITLTYDDKNLPVVNKITGEIYRGIKYPLDYYGKAKRYEVARLHKKDFQDFMKRLRINAERKGWVEDPEKGIRYFMCGEYGSKGKRPHYHAIIYGLKLPDLNYNYTAKKHMHFRSTVLEEIWGRGIVDVGGVDYESCQYVARYVVKKQGGKAGEEYYKKEGLAKEFVSMSLKPAIGKQYFDDEHMQIYMRDKMYLKCGRKQKPPRQYDVWEDKYQLEQEDQASWDELKELYKAADLEGRTLLRMQSVKMQELKRERRKKALDALFAELAKTTKGVIDYLDDKAQRYEDKHSIAREREMLDKGTKRAGPPKLGGLPTLVI